MNSKLDWEKYVYEWKLVPIEIFNLLTVDFLCMGLIQFLCSATHVAIIIMRTPALASFLRQLHSTP